MWSGPRPREPKLTTIDRSRYLSREELQTEIDDVYAILREIAGGLAAGGR